MLQLLHVIPASELALGDRVRTGHGPDSYVTVKRVRRGEAGVQVAFGGGEAVRYRPDESVSIIECVFEEQLEDTAALAPL